MHRFAHFELSELKLVYRVLHANLTDHVELMDTRFLDQLQRWLQTVAGQQGVDVSDHSAWDAWLGNTEVPCEERVARRKVLRMPGTERAEDGDDEGPKAG